MLEELHPRRKGRESGEFDLIAAER